MVKRIVNVLILIPIAIVLIVLSVANRQSVTLALNPFRPEDQVLSLHAPLFVLLFAALILGLLVGAAVTWFNQGKHRKRARSQSLAAAASSTTCCRCSCRSSAKPAARPSSSRASQRPGAAARW